MRQRIQVFPDAAEQLGKSSTVPISPGMVSIVVQFGVRDEDRVWVLLAAPHLQQAVLTRQCLPTLKSSNVDKVQGRNIHSRPINCLPVQLAVSFTI